MDVIQCAYMNTDVFLAIFEMKAKLVQICLNRQSYCFISAESIFFVKAEHSWKFYLVILSK